MPETRNWPALDAEDWEYFLSGGVRKHTLQDAVECAERGRRDMTPHALAALALHGESYGFTLTDFDLCHSAAHHFDRFAAECEARGLAGGHANREAASMMRDLAAKIRALLPP